MHLKKTVQLPVRSNMTNLKSTTSSWALATKLLLALPFLVLLGASIPSAQADQHHGFYRRHGYYRHHYRHYHHHRGYYYRHGRRYYYGDNGYYAPRSGVSVNVGL